MGEHHSTLNGRLLLAGLRPWQEWPAGDLLDVCDALIVEEQRFIISLRAKIPLPELPQVDAGRLGLRTPAGLGVLEFTAHTPAPVDDGTWGLESDSWDPSGEGGEGL